MDTSVVPGDTTFEVTVDGTDYPLTIGVWDDADTLTASYVGPYPAVSAFCRQLIHDPNCISALGTYARASQRIQWFPRP